MDAPDLIRYISDNFEAIQMATADDNCFFYYGPEGTIPERTFPFATLVTRDDYDMVSDLSREGVCRLNIGLRKETYRSLLGEPPSAPEEGGVVETGHDFTALDQIMPHPIYGHLHWICVLNPGDATLETAKSLLAEAYQAAVEKHAGKSAKSDS